MLKPVQGDQNIVLDAGRATDVSGRCLIGNAMASEVYVKEQTGAG